MSMIYVDDLSSERRAFAAIYDLALMLGVLVSMLTYIGEGGC